MDTLKRVRKGDRIKVLDREVLSNQDAAYVTVELNSRDERTILVVTRHSDEIVDKVLKGVDQDDSGYIFFASELDIDPLNNCMVPKHRIARDDEIDNLRNRGIPLDKLPILRMLDPVRRWHNFPKGSIVAIERTDQSLHFRRVV